MSDKNQPSDEEFFTDIDDDIKSLENDLLGARPVTRSSLKKVNKKATSGLISNKKSSKLLPDNFLRVDGDSQSGSGTSNDAIVKAMGDTADEITESMNDVHSKLRRMLSLMGQFSTRIKTVEGRVEQHESSIDDLQRENRKLTDRCENLERVSCFDKIVMTFDKFDTNSNAYQAVVKKVLSEDLKLSSSMVEQIGISKFGTSKSTVLLHMPSMAARFAIFNCKPILRRNQQKYSNLFINEYLTVKNTALMKSARELKKKKHISSVFSLNGKVYVKKKENDDKTLIRCMNDLDAMRVPSASTSDAASTTSDNE